MPFDLRRRLARDAGPLSAVHRSFNDVIVRSLQGRATEGGGRCGAVSFVQRFGGSLNLNVHFQTVALDGVYTRSSLMAPPVFHQVGAPSALEIEEISEWIAERVKGLLRRRGLFPREGEWTGGEDEKPSAFDHRVQAAARDPQPGAGATAARTTPHQTCFRGLAGAPASTWRADIVPGPRVPEVTAATPALKPQEAAGSRWSWAALLERVYDIEALRCLDAMVPSGSSPRSSTRPWFAGASATSACRPNRSRLLLPAIPPGTSSHCGAPDPTAIHLTLPRSGRLAHGSA